MTDIFAEIEADAASGRFTRAPTEEELRSLTGLGNELMEIEARLMKYAVVAAQLVERKNAIQSRHLPALMDEVGQDVIGLAEHGVDIRVEDYFKAGLPNPDTGKTDEEKLRLHELREQGVAFLSEAAPDLLQTTVVVSLPKGKLETAQAIQRTLLTPEGRIAITLPADARELALTLIGEITSQQGYGIPEDQVSLIEAEGFGLQPGQVTLAEGAHWATLTSWLKDVVTNKKIELEKIPLEAIGATLGRFAKIVKRRAKK
jgi:hypothetical protein